MTAKMYDVETDDMREVTQQDYDRVDMVARLFLLLHRVMYDGERVKSLRPIEQLRKIEAALVALDK